VTGKKSETYEPINRGKELVENQYEAHFGDDQHQVDVFRALDSKSANPMNLPIDFIQT
jgi:hypothetical protein